MNSDRLAKQYALLTFLSHALVISLSLVPAIREDSLTAGDAQTYIVPAQNIVEHGQFSREAAAPYVWEPYRTPGYPFCIAASIQLLDGYEWVLYLAAMSAACAAWCVVTLVGEWGGGRIALHAAGLIIAFLPNSLGLSAQILTDATAGHLTLVWLYFLITGCKTRSLIKLGLSAVLLLVLQSFKPTFNIAGVLIALVVFIYCVGQKRVVTAIILIALSVPLQVYFSQRNLQAHGVYSPSLLGIETVREYLQVRGLQEVTGGDYAVLTNKVRAEDRADAEKLSTPASKYGRLYVVKTGKVDAFFREHPFAAIRLMFTEMVQQFAAPQEFFPQVFVGDLPQWGRGLGSLLTLALWGCACAGGYACWRQGQWQAAVLVAGVLGFFLVTGSVSHLVGARLRFPADVAAIPLAGIGAASLARFVKGVSKV